MSKINGLVVSWSRFVQMQVMISQLISCVGSRFVEVRTQLKVFKLIDCAVRWSDFGQMQVVNFQFIDCVTSRVFERQNQV